MWRRTSLSRLNDAFGTRVRRLRVLANTAAAGTDAAADRMVAFVLIETLTTWSSFAREYYLSCAIMRPKTISGSRVVHSNATVTQGERDALVYAIRILKGKVYQKPRVNPLDEPVWREKRCLASLSAGLQLSNDADIVSGLSYPTTFFNQAFIVRNFFAHRTENTAARVRDLAKREYSLTIGQPIQLVNSRFGGRSLTLAQEWLYDLEAIARAMCN